MQVSSQVPFGCERFQAHRALDHCGSYDNSKPIQDIPVLWQEHDPTAQYCMPCAIIPKGKTPWPKTYGHELIRYFRLMDI